MNELYEITEVDRLNEAFKEVRKASPFKTSTQRYEANVLSNNIKLQEDIRSGRYRQDPMLHFYLNERGKERDIHAPAVKDRVAQKVVNQDILLKHLRKYLIYDNYASLEQRGTALARKRHLIHLRNFIAEHGTDGYILQVDIRKYFDSIDHDVCCAMVLPLIPESTRDLVKYMIHNASETDKGLNLGSEVPQTLAVFYLHNIDDYCKIVEGIKYYGRYMDDIFIFGHDKAELRRVLDGIRERLVPLKLELNEKKTQIVKLTHGYTFMQLKYRVLNTGKVVVSPAPAKITRERRKLKAYKRIYDKGKITETEIRNAYMSWRESILRDCSCKRSVHNLDELYKELFGTSPFRNASVKVARRDIPDVEGEKHYILSETPFTRRVGKFI